MSKKPFVIWTEMNDEWKTIRYLNRNEWRVKNHSSFKPKWMVSEKPFIIQNEMNDEWKTIYYLNGVFKYFFIRMCPSLLGNNTTSETFRNRFFDSNRQRKTRTVIRHLLSSLRQLTTLWPKVPDFTL